MDIVDFMDNMLKKGVKFSLKGNELRCKVRKGILVKTDVDFIKKNKLVIVEFINKAMRQSTERFDKKVELLPRNGQHFPLTNQQLSLWFIYQMDKSCFSYNIPLVYEIKGQLDIDLLVQCVEILYQRHEVLRTRFIEVEDFPVQIINNEHAFTVPVIPSKLDELKQRIKNESEYTFDLNNEPLFRAKLLVFSEVHYVLMINMHHIISDGTSIQILLNELSTLYRSKAESTVLTELQAQYADYSLWQFELITTQAYQNSKQYWLKLLDSVPKSLTISTRKNHSKVPSNHGLVQSFTLSDNTANLLRGLAKHCGCSLYVVLLTAFKIALYSYSRQQEIIVGTPNANRQSIEVENTIGFFANPIPIVTKIYDDASLLSLLSNVKDRVMKGFEHQEVALVDIVNGLNERANSSTSELFQVLFSLDVGLDNLFSLEGAKCAAISQEWQISKFDLTLYMRDNNDKSIVGLIEYRSQLFDRTEVGQIIKDYEALLENMVKDPGQPISSLTKLTSFNSNASKIGKDTLDVKSCDHRQPLSFINEHAVLSAHCFIG